jgi:N-acetyl sugar amidotransferase|tara:strand:- start:180 stop:1340 length:1161 start_codon:yes stop_codon:yes gene_type:complete
MIENVAYQRCTKGVWDTTVPGIRFDQNGVSNYATMIEKLAQAYPRGDKGEREWSKIVSNIKKKGKNKKYDCIIGVSGGTDSSYLMHLAIKKYGLKPLAVNLDNGWSSDIAVKNIKKITSELEIDLETYVIDYDEVKAVLRSYMKASLPWIDSPTDLAIKAVLYKIASRENIKYILNGSDFRSEGKQPTEWTYSDAKQLLFIVKKYERIRLKSYPYYNIIKLFNYGFIKGIKMIRPFYYLDYQKVEANKFLMKYYNWEYYGGHHHENIFTKFAIAYWLPKKFDIDKRIITLSAQILNGEVKRKDAIDILQKPPYNLEQMEKDKDYVIKKLGLIPKDFTNILQNTNKNFSNYPSYMPLLKKYHKLASKYLKLVLPVTPGILFENEERK